MKKESLTAWTYYLYKEIYKACRLQGDYKPIAFPAAIKNKLRTRIAFSCKSIFERKKW
jgi:hypothetical protein